MGKDNRELRLAGTHAGERNKKTRPESEISPRSRVPKTAVPAASGGRFGWWRFCVEAACSLRRNNWVGPPNAFCKTKSNYFLSATLTTMSSYKIQRNNGRWDGNQTHLSSFASETPHRTRPPLHTFVPADLHRSCVVCLKPRLLRRCCYGRRLQPACCCELLLPPLSSRDETKGLPSLRPVRGY